jgi:hypothetical protein
MSVNLEPRLVLRQQNPETVNTLRAIGSMDRLVLYDGTARYLT